MRYADAAAFRQALEDRLRRRAGGVSARVARDRKRVMFDRFLARLTAVAPDGWLVKGGFALELRLTGRARTTKDVDLAWWDNDDELVDTLLDAAGYDAGDFFAFTVEHAGIATDRLGGTRRFRVAAELAGRPFDAFVLDIGIGTGPARYADRLTTPDMLGFAGLDPVTVPAVPLENQVAEKVHTYTRVYPGSRPSTRVKDLVDLALIARLSPLDAASLAQAIDATFAWRGSHQVPNALPFPPAEWRAPFTALAGGLDVPTGLAAGHRVVAAFLDPILNSAVRAGMWSPGRGGGIPGHQTAPGSKQD